MLIVAVLAVIPLLTLTSLAVITPTTCKAELGDSVPIPTFPVFLITIATVPLVPGFKATSE